MRAVIQQIPIYNGKIGLIVTSDARDLYKVFNKDSVNDTTIINARDLYAHSLILNHKGFTCYTIVLNFENSKTKITPGVIAHEALHIVNMVFSHRGVEYTQEHDEHTAYFIDWVVTFVHTQLKKWNLEKELITNK